MRLTLPVYPAKGKRERCLQGMNHDFRAPAATVPFTNRRKFRDAKPHRRTIPMDSMLTYRALRTDFLGAPVGANHGLTFPHLDGPNRLPLASSQFSSYV